MVARYHDQGHIPAKLLGLSVNPKTERWDAWSGANITIGLSIIHHDPRDISSSPRRAAC